MIKLNKLIACAVCAVMLIVSGCKTNDPDVPTGIVDPISKLALITNDIELELDFDYAAVWEGIVSCAEANNLNYGYYRPNDMTEESLKTTFESAIEDGATVVISLGDVFAPVISQMQEKHPATKFVAIDVSEDSIGTLKSNTHCIMFRQEQGGYLAGYGAVKDGFTKLGFMGDHVAEAYSSYAYGFVNGINDAAKELEKQVTVDISYISSYENRDEALSQLNNWYAGGTEITMICADEDFTVSSAHKAVENFGYLIGTNNDQSYLTATLDYNPFITSAIKGIREAIDTTLEMILAGKWDQQLGGRTLYFGLQNGNYIYLPDNEGTWLFEGFNLEEYNSLKDTISQGEITIESKQLPDVDTSLVTVNVIENAE